ncbi:hypothetical protein ABBQ32_008879 [Trebouxia sp. C0010 RCD-2024]
MTMAAQGDNGRLRCVALLWATAMLAGNCVQAGCGNDCTCLNEVSCTAGTAKKNCCWTGSKCVNFNTDIKNCGACGNVCPAPAGTIAVCTAGKCSSRCDTGYTMCGSQCVPACTCPTTCPDVTIDFVLSSTPSIITSELNTIELDGGAGSLTIPSGQTVTKDVQTGRFLFNTACSGFRCNPVVGSSFDTTPNFLVNGVSSTLDVNGQSGDGSSSAGINFSNGKAASVIQLPGCQTLTVLSQGSEGTDSSGASASAFTTQASFSVACFT